MVFSETSGQVFEIPENVMQLLRLHCKCSSWSHECERHSKQLSRQVTAFQHFLECSRNFTSECCRGSVLVFFDCAHQTAEWFTSLGTHSPCAGSGNTALCCTVQIQDVPSSHCGMLFSLWKEQKQMDMLHLS